MPDPVLKSVIRTQGNNAALKAGGVAVAGSNLDFVDVPVLVHAFRRMVRCLEFDLCEMALTTYLCAREHGVRFTALPIFLVRAFHHGAIVHHKDSGLTDPRELEGKRVGVHRGYTVTTGVWARSVLQDEYGVDLSKVTWVLSGDEHVESYSPPENVVSIEAGKTIEELLVSGNLSAAIGLNTQNSDIVPMIPDALDAGIRAFETRGHYPINHLVVLRNDVLDTHPQLAVSVFNAFAESKAVYLQQLRECAIDKTDATDKLYAQLLAAGVDPLPYGVGPNRQVLDELIRHATTQQILRNPPLNAESVFARSTLDLTA